jgi:type III pantothenate kinase
MILLLDIGNTTTHIALADARRVRRPSGFPTLLWQQGQAGRELSRLAGASVPSQVALCSVVPSVTPLAVGWVRDHWDKPVAVLTHRNAPGLRFRYPKPQTIGADRLANLVALKHHYGAPAVSLDIGTATTLEVLDAEGFFIGGIITAGPAALAEYLTEKTARLPRVMPQRVRSVLGRSTRESMLVGVVRGYQGLVRELVGGLQAKFACQRLSVVATGGGLRWLPRKLPGVTDIRPDLTLEGLRLFACANK